MDVRRLVAPNPGPLTGEGTNTWLVGQDVVVVIDPGPALPAHAAALDAALKGARVEAILLTHGHDDHAGLAMDLHRQHAAPLFAHGAPLRGTGGESSATLIPTQALRGGERLALAGATIEVIATPGHTPDHLCLALGDTLFSGDHVMGWSTTLVAPPDGDMAAYMASLATLGERHWARFLPGHGSGITDPAQRLSDLIAHRLAREAAILDLLHQSPATAEVLALAIYSGLSPSLLPAAALSVLAHLVKLQSEGRAQALPARTGTPTPRTRFARGPA